MLETARLAFLNIFSALFENLDSEKSLLVTPKILVLSLYTLTADDKYSLCNKDNLQQPIQMELSNKQNFFSQLSAASVKFTFQFHHFEEKMSLMALLFRKL